ncbi:MAG TPA: response regulator [Rhizomicrobium sp.]|jgi:DNA-binding response OmpR family regulator|nr:response regulator [Rhizomicrobium sp.]
MTAAGVHDTTAPRRRVLVAEDEFLVYLELEQELLAHGFEVLGPFATVPEAREALARERVTLALLDINLGGEMVFPVADELVARNVPFIFLSGYASGAVPDDYRRFPRLEKPYDPAKLLAALAALPEPTA